MMMSKDLLAGDAAAGPSPTASPVPTVHGALAEGVQSDPRGHKAAAPAAANDEDLLKKKVVSIKKKKRRSTLSADEEDEVSSGPARPMKSVASSDGGAYRSGEGPLAVPGKRSVHNADDSFVVKLSSDAGEAIGSGELPQKREHRSQHHVHLLVDPESDKKVGQESTRKAQALKSMKTAKLEPVASYKSNTTVIKEDAHVVKMSSKPRRSAAEIGKAMREGKPGAARSKGLRSRVGRILTNQYFQALMMLVLMIALFGTALAIVIDIPDHPGIVVLDTIMTAIMIIFFFELVVTSFVHYRTYFCSYFFWMDLMGTLSMMFEISYMFGTAGQFKESGGTASIDTVLLRSARAAKMGARIGRLAKTMKCMTAKHKTDEPEEEEPDDVKVISRKLMMLLSTKVSVLALVLMLVSPLFSLALYPQADFSMKAWMETLETAYETDVKQVVSREKLILQAKTDSVAASFLVSDFYKVHQGAREGAFKQAVMDMLVFYKSSNYFPLDMTGFPEHLVVEGFNVYVPGQELVKRTTPNRADSTFRQAVDGCKVQRAECPSRDAGSNKAYMEFDFTLPQQLESAMDMCMIVFMLFVMTVCTFDLSRTLDKAVLMPLNRIMGVVRHATASILQQVSVMVDEKSCREQLPEVDEEDDAVAGSELAMLEMVLEKLSTLMQLWMQENVVDDEHLKSLTLEGRGVILDMMQLGKIHTKYAADSASSHDLSGSVEMDKLLDRMKEQNPDFEVTWSMDVLTITASELACIIPHIFFHTAIGKRVRHLVPMSALTLFSAEAQQVYQNQPYHCWQHAIDVLHTVHFCLTLCHSNTWLDSCKEFAMLMAALSHDLGHFGRTNQFLVETRHDMALRYNDKSPLENMHCASLFELCTKDGSDVFGRLSPEQYAVARKVCIDTILHTDNSHHFAMVKELSKIYELNNKICDSQAQSLEDFTLHFVDDVLTKNEMVMLQLFLHFADVSNPLKEFQMCKAWAGRVMEEFFDQGDEEKRLGIPVGMLNDRTKVNFPSSQHGFINFLVSPLVLATVRIFHPLLSLAQEMVMNLENWCEIWAAENDPGEKPVADRKAEIQSVRKSVMELEKRGEIDGGEKANETGMRFATAAHTVHGLGQGKNRNSMQTQAKASTALQAAQRATTKRGSAETNVGPSRS